jgi:hypothetical protein
MNFLLLIKILQFQLKKMEKDEIAIFLLKAKNSLSEEKYENFQKILPRLKIALNKEQISIISTEIKNIFINNPNLLESFKNFIPISYKSEFLNNFVQNEENLKKSKKRKDPFDLLNGKKKIQKSNVINIQKFDIINNNEKTNNNFDIHSYIKNKKIDDDVVIINQINKKEIKNKEIDDDDDDDDVIINQINKKEIKNKEIKNIIYCHICTEICKDPHANKCGHINVNNSNNYNK